MEKRGNLCSFFFSSRRRHTRYIGDWSSDVCSSDLARGRRDVGEVAADRDGQVVEPGAARVRRVETHDLHRAALTLDEGVHPGVRRALADKVTGDVARRHVQQAEDAEQDVGVVLADAHPKMQGHCRRGAVPGDPEPVRDRGRGPALRELGALGGVGRAMRDVQRGIDEPLVRRGERRRPEVREPLRLGAPGWRVQQCRGRCALEPEDGLEVDRLGHAVRDDAGDAIPELVALPGQPVVALGPADGEVVLEQALPQLEVARNHDEALMEVPDRSGVGVPVMLPHAKDGAPYVRPVWTAQDRARAAASALSASSSRGGPPGRSAVISSDHTVNFASRAFPYAVESAQSTASRPRPITTRPTRGVLWRASNVYHRPPTYASNHVWKSIGTSGGSIAMSGR